MDPATTPPPASAPKLFDRVSAGIFWNTLLLPVVTLGGIATSILIRRHFGLASGSYDILIGLVNTMLFYSSIGIPTSLMKTLPEHEIAGGKRAVVRLLLRAATARFAILVPFLVALHVFAAPIADWLHLEAEGVSYLRVVTALVVVRAANDLIGYTLYAFLAQLRVNLMILLQSLLDPLFVAVALGLGYGIAGVLVAIAASGAVVAIVGLGFVLRAVSELPPRVEASASPPSAAWKFSLFDYSIELSRYFGGPDFSRMALALVVADRGLVAIFAVGFFIPSMVVTLIASIFRGVYRPMFARLRAEGRFSEAARAFAAISKVQIALLLPAGVGLAVMAGDYVPLLYGSSFAPAVPVTRLLILLLFAETAFNQAIIILSVDERYATVLGAMAIQLLAAPLMMAAAFAFGIEAGAFVLGLGRVATAAVCYGACRRRYALRFPWGFAANVAIPSLAMLAVLAVGRVLWATSVIEAITLTLVGAVTFAIGLRIRPVLGAEERALLRRANLPFASGVLRFLAVDGAKVRR